MAAVAARLQRAAGDTAPPPRLDAPSDAALLPQLEAAVACVERCADGALAAAAANAPASAGGAGGAGAKTAAAAGAAGGAAGAAGTVGLSGA